MLLVSGFMSPVAFRLDRSSQAPLYQQLAQQLQAAIKRGEVVPGDFISGEIELADQWRVSRPTVRRAIQDLVSSGLVERRRGVGTMVVARDIKRSPKLSGLFEDLVLEGRNPTNEVLSYARTKLNETDALAINLPTGSEVVRLQRVRIADGIRLALLTNILPLDIAADISRADLVRTGLYDLLRLKGVHPTTAIQRIGARSATVGEAKRLDLDTDVPLLTVHRVTCDDSGRVIEVGNHVYSARNYFVEMRLSNEQESDQL